MSDAAQIRIEICIAKAKDGEPMWIIIRDPVYEETLSFGRRR
jgi:hypothetical protein